MKSYGQLRAEVATEMWKIWCPVEPMPIVPFEFYKMAEYAIKATNEQFDSMLSEAIKARLEKLLADDGVD